MYDTRDIRSFRIEWSGVMCSVVKAWMVVSAAFGVVKKMEKLLIDMFSSRTFPVLLNIKTIYSMVLVLVVGKKNTGRVQKG